MGDISLLDVGSIVGPPYAITDVFPSLGPITGGTQVRPSYAAPIAESRPTESRPRIADSRHERSLTPTPSLAGRWR